MCPFKIISLAKSINYVFQLLHVVGGVGRAGLMKNAIELHYVVCIKCVWCVDPRKSSPLLWWILIKNKQTNYGDCSIQFILRYLHTHTFYSEAPQTVWDCNSKLLGRSSHCKYPGVMGAGVLKHLSSLLYSLQTVHLWVFHSVQTWIFLALIFCF